MSHNFAARTTFVALTVAALAGLPTAQAAAGARGAEAGPGLGVRAVARGAQGFPTAGVPAGVRGAEVFVEVTPSTVEAGERIRIQAGCDASEQAASVRSDAFGRVSVRPDNGLLTGTATVPDRKPPDTYDVVLTCRDKTTASTTLTVVNMSKATRGPATGAGGAAGGMISPLVLTGGLGVVAVGAGLALVIRGRRGAGSGR